jgi:hypothetical protein
VGAAAQARPVLKAAARCRRAPAARPGGLRDLVEQHLRAYPGASGQIESVYIDMPGIGLAKFAPVTPARGSLFSARRRLGMREGSEPPPGIAEEELYRR